MTIRATISGLLLGLMVSGGGVHAQAPAAKVDTATAAAPADAPPLLTDLERTKLDLIQLRTAYAQLLAQYDACKGEVGSAYNALGQFHAQTAQSELSQEQLALKALVEKDHPGYDYDVMSGAFTKKPAPPAGKK